MEYWEGKVICLKVSADKIMNTSFVLAVTPQEVISIKLPTNIERYKFANLISPPFVLEVDLVKTKKNWVLRNILGFEELIKLNEYKTLVNVSNIVKTVTKYIQEGEQTDIFDFLVKRIREARAEQTGGEVNLIEFEADLMQKLGFTSRDKTYTGLENAVYATKKGKTENDLRVKE